MRRREEAGRRGACLLLLHGPFPRGVPQVAEKLAARARKFVQMRKAENLKTQPSACEKWAGVEGIRLSCDRKLPSPLASPPRGRSSHPRAQLQGRGLLGHHEHHVPITI